MYIHYKICFIIMHLKASNRFQNIFKIGKVKKFKNRASIVFMILPIHLFPISLNPGGQLEQLYPRPNLTSSSGERSVQFLFSGQGFCMQPSMFISHFSPVWKSINQEHSYLYHHVGFFQYILAFSTHLLCSVELFQTK